ncbi:MAG: MurT ligase domain-containing protein [Clostridia bacterium]|jgi:UDP-N-acetylmuramyl tripeptide synthase
MNIRLTLAIIVSKLAIKACRLVKWGGTSLPGTIARKIYPGILKLISKDFNLIMVTGTNGKTTTTLIIAKMLEENGIEYITNKSGANLVSGITATFIDAVNLMGKSTVKTALIEIDEAAFNKFSEQRSPDILVVTNFFRDQLDRYGELYSTLLKVKLGIVNSPGVKLVLNADDSLCASLGKDTGRDSVYYGFEKEAYNFNSKNSGSDATFCIYCKTKYEYMQKVYGHLGHFLCPNCGYTRPATEITCSKITALKSSNSIVKIRLSNTEHDIKINLPGLYNIYNALAALGVSKLFNLDTEKSVRALSIFDSGFGRMESIDVFGKTINVILVKNPTGFNQVLSFLFTEEKDMQIAFAINDKIADGTDVSWLWDVDFEELRTIENKIGIIYASGIRADDMALRLKYAGVSTEKIQIEEDYNNLIEIGLSNTKEGQTFYILPTYTAMLAIRKILKKKYKLKEFWK